MTDDAITLQPPLNPPLWTGGLIQEGPFRNAFEHATIGMALADRQGRYLAANRAFCEMVGYSEHELAQLDFSAITHPGDLPENLRLGQQLLRGEIQSFEYEKRYLHKSGRIIWCLLSASVALGDTGDQNWAKGRSPVVVFPRLSPKVAITRSILAVFYHSFYHTLLIYC